MRNLQHVIQQLCFVVKLQGVNMQRVHAVRLSDCRRYYLFLTGVFVQLLARRREGCLTLSLINRLNQTESSVFKL